VSVAVAPTAPQSLTGPTTLTQNCNQFDQSNPVQPFSVVIDNSRSTVASTYHVIISDPLPIAPDRSTPIPSSTTRYWAVADSPSGNLPPRQRVSIAISPLSTLCQGMPPGTPIEDFHVFVTYGGAATVTVTDSVSPQVIG
jgi:hypothetical protein